MFCETYIPYCKLEEELVEIVDSVAEDRPELSKEEIASKLTIIHRVNIDNHIERVLESKGVPEELFEFFNDDAFIRDKVYSGAWLPVGNFYILNTKGFQIKI